MLLAGGGAAAVWKFSGQVVPTGTADLGAAAVATRGPFVVSVTETGEVEAERRKIIANELQWPVIIRSVVEEGARVADGQTIVAFECKELADAITLKQIEVTNASASYTQARENLILKRKEMDNQVRKARQAVVDANADIQRYIEGEGPIKLSDAEADIQTARRDLALAQDKLNFKLEVNANKELKSPFSDNEIEADKLGVERLKLALQKAINNRQMLNKYDHPRQIANLKMAIEDARLALARAELEARSQVLQAEADSAAKKATFDMQTKKLDELQTEAAKLVVKADKEGLVVYDTGKQWYQSDSFNIEVGAKITPRQQLMIIPDMSTLQVKTKVYESIIDQVRERLPATIRLDARPDSPIRGHVERVAVLPSSQHRWLNPGVKIFDVIVKFDQPAGDLKPGMSAQVEIELARLHDVLSVPVSAVFTEQERTYCYRLTDGQARRAPIKVGRMNDTRVEVVAGLAEGDEILLSPPATTEGEAPAAGQAGRATSRPATRPARSGAPGAGAGSGERRRPPKDGGGRRPR